MRSDRRAGERAVLVELVAQGAVPVEELHDDVVRAAVAAGVVDVDQARVGERGGGARLAEEPLGERVVVGCTAAPAP